MLDDKTVLRLNPDVRFRAIFGEGVILRQAAAEIVVVNEMGARIFEEIDGVRSAEDIVNRLDGEYAVPLAELKVDVLDYLDQLAASGVIVQSDEY